MFSLRPKNQKFFDLLGRAAKNAVEIARTYKSLVKNYRLDHPGITQIRDLEHEGDLITHDLLDKLNRTRFPPFSRSDIYELARDIDNIVDAVQSVSDRMALYHVEGQDLYVGQLAEILEKATIEVEKAIREMVGFKTVRRVMDHCIEIGRLDAEGDAVLKSALENLFKGVPHPIHVIKWKDVYEITGMAIHRCKNAANLLEGIVIKNE